MTNTTTTTMHASEAISIPPYSEFKPRLTRKSPMASLTASEQRIIAAIGAGLDLGHVSYPLLYSRALPLSKLERNALFNLVYNGRVVLLLTNCPTTYLLQATE